MAAIQPDWGLIQQLYMQGIALAAISARTGVKPTTIASRACRARWREIAAQSTQVAQSIAAKELAKAEEIIDSLSKASESTRIRTARAIEAALDKLPIPESWSQAAKQQSQLEPLVRNARTVFGWDAHGDEPLIRINLMSQMRLVTDKDVIDIPCVPVPQNKELLNPVPAPQIEGGTPL